MHRSVVCTNRETFMFVSLTYLHRYFDIANVRQNAAINACVTLINICSFTQAAENPRLMCIFLHLAQ